MNPMVDQSTTSKECIASVCDPYLQTLTLIERLHRRLLDLIKDQLDRSGRHDITAHQALIIYNVADQELCVGDLRTRGYYLGTNVSYNLRKLVDSDLIEHQRSQADRRAVRIKLTAKGREVQKMVETLCERHVGVIEHASGIAAEELARLNKLLHRLNRFWTDQVVYRL